MTSRKLRRMFLLAALVVLLGANYAVKAGEEGLECEYCPTSTSDCAPCPGLPNITCRDNCNKIFGTCSLRGAICQPPAE